MKSGSLKDNNSKKLPAHQVAIAEETKKQFAKIFGDTRGVVIAMAPGRVNLIGEHTDYNDGFALPMTVDSGIYWAIRQRNDDHVRLHSIKFDDVVEYSLSKGPDASPGSWSSYVCGVVEELRKRGFVDRGFEGVVLGNLPLGAGLSSSAALEISTAVALQELFAFSFSAIGMVQMCQQVEHIYAGVECGIMDQFACRLGRRRHALLLDCRSLEHQDVPWAFQDMSVVIVDSGVSRALSSSKYNERRAECLQAVSVLQSIDPSIKSLRDATVTMLDEHRDRFPAPIEMRARHIVTENQRVLDAAAHLRSGDHKKFGELMIQSHLSLRDQFEVSCAELDCLVSIALNAEGVVGARMTGAGFGGCTVNLVASNSVEALQQRIQKEYPRSCDRDATIFVLRENSEAGLVERL